MGKKRNSKACLTGGEKFLAVLQRRPVCGVGDSNDAGGVAEEVEKEIVERRGRNWGKELIFSQLWTQIFFTLRAWNPPLFIGGGIGTCCFYWCQILALNSNQKNPNHLKLLS